MISQILFVAVSAFVERGVYSGKNFTAGYDVEVIARDADFALSFMVNGHELNFGRIDIKGTMEPSFQFKCRDVLYLSVPMPSDERDPDIKISLIQPLTYMFDSVDDFEEKGDFKIPESLRPSFRGLWNADGDCVGKALKSVASKHAEYNWNLQGFYSEGTSEFLFAVAESKGKDEEVFVGTIVFLNSSSPLSITALLVALLVMW